MISTSILTTTARSTPSSLSHPELVNACIYASPHDPIWTEFKNRFHTWIERYLQKACKHNHQGNSHREYSRETLTDLVQDVYVILLNNGRQALRNFNGTTDGSFLAYLSVICTNVVRERQRKRRASKRASSVTGAYLLRR